MTAMMESTPRNLIDAMFRIQNGLNTKSYDSSWIEKGKTEEFDYAMAAGDEAHEFARSLPFQWWTKDKADRQNQVTEIVDAWHFVMSQMIIDHDGDVDAAAREASGWFTTAQRITPCASIQRQVKLFVASMYAHNGPCMLAWPIHYVQAFFSLCSHAKIDLQLLYDRYVAKAELNKFRVEHGYKQGTYKKIWEINGVKGEDNFFLSSYVDRESAAGTYCGAADARKYLIETYARVSAGVPI